MTLADFCVVERYDLVTAPVDAAVDRIADDAERSLITLQVEMGVAVRMACLEMLIGSPA